MYEKSRRAFVLGATALAVTATLAKPKKQRHKKPTGSEVQTADRILGELAASMWGGFEDDGKSLDDLEAMIADGKRPIILCTKQSLLGVRALQREGFVAREAGVFTREPFANDGVTSDGHVIMEAKLDGTWRAYDLSCNRGSTLSVPAICKTSDRRWYAIADDVNFAPQPPSLASTDPVAWERRVFQMPWLADADGAAWFHDPERREAVAESYPWVNYAEKRQWEQMVK